MTSRFLLRVALALFLVALSRNTPCAAQQEVQKDWRIFPKKAYYIYHEGSPPRWLTVIDGELWFQDWEAGRKNPDFLRDHPAIKTLKVRSDVWEFDGEHLQAWVSYDRRSKERGITAAHDGVLRYYLTADYETHPPRVVLTKEPTDDSRWKLEKPDFTTTKYVDPNAGMKYLRNVNDSGVDAWLTWEEAEFVGILERPGEPPATIGLRRPQLSLDRKTAFHIRTYLELEDKGK